MHAPPVPLQPSRIEQPNNPQQLPMQQRPEPYYVQPRSEPTQQTYMSEMTKFLVKKDIVKLRLSKFMDIPGTFVSWKTTFQSVLRELEVSPLKELDLLQQYLGPESSRYAASIRAANLHNPMRGVEKIWDRLNDKYGRPEVIEASLKTKLLAFPKMSVRDSKKLFDLADLLSEIESVKENPQYSALLSYFDTSAGINPVINKLPTSLQEKWVTTAVKYKKTHNVVFPPFSQFVQFIHELAQVKNDPSFQYETSQSYTAASREQPKWKPREPAHNTTIITTKLTSLKVFLKILNYAPYME